MRQAFSRQACRLDPARSGNRLAIIESETVTEPLLLPEVRRAFDAFPVPMRKRLLQVRDLIFATASAHDGVGRLSETLKWGEPAYLTEETGSGSTIRLGRLKDSDHAAILFNCKTTLVDTFRERFPEQFEYRQTRALLLPVAGKLPTRELSVCLSLALTYHLDRRSKRAR
ncbi:hypothetical protein IQ17_02985 [Bradyrhizobium daqingense]|uniref:YdhG-like domain-containing protein n=1 Tax=Bradyrhizobium daqingense TaxID=993502 RepID=A0A562LD64_9BRAD|nr:hypothetical protein IQ17_02985 [Bradyrhizobium daqingense]